MTNAPGKTLLKISGIIMLVFGGFVALMGFLAIIGSSTMGSDAIYAVIGGIAFIISGGFNILVGLIGVKNCEKPEKAGLCMTWGIIALVLQVISLFLSFSMWSLLALALPILFVLGANQNKKAFEQGMVYGGQPQYGQPPQQYGQQPPQYGQQPPQYGQQPPQYGQQPPQYQPPMDQQIPQQVEPQQPQNPQEPPSQP